MLLSRSSKLNVQASARPQKPHALPRQSVAPPKSPRQRAAEAAKIALAGVASAALVLSPVPTAQAELNKFEANIEGEFAGGPSQQWGDSEIDGRDFSNQDFRRSNFTSASAKKTNFSNSNFSGAYFIKAVVAGANFENARVTDVLFDRAVIVDANLRNANFERTVFTRSDLSRSDIYGADFSNALLDKPMQMKLCRYADGVNPTTGISTRASLGCGSMRKFKASTPSADEGPQVPEEDKEAFREVLGPRGGGK